MRKDDGVDGVYGEVASAREGETFDGREVVGKGLSD